MSGPQRDLPQGDLALILERAYSALDSGESHGAKALAQELLAKAQERGNQQMESRALLCLASCDMLLSHLRRASDASRRAAQLSQALNDVTGEATALTKLAHVCTHLGRNEEAIEAALLSVRLCDTLSPQTQTVTAYNYLGTAYGWSGSFDAAQAALEAAIQVALRCSPPVSTYQPRQNQVWVEALRLVAERHESRLQPSLERMKQLLSRSRSLEAAGDSAPLLPGLQVVGRTLSLLQRALLCCWEADYARARIELDSAYCLLQGFEGNNWVHAIASWVSAELAWAHRDWAKAETAIAEVIELAANADHEQLACLGHLLASQIFEQQGKLELANGEYRRLRRRKLRIAAESMKSREAVVAWQLGARQSEQSLQRLAAVSKQFERWSLEDALTGIANRRCFEQRLTEQMSTVVATSQPVSVALIDIDRFKAVNDRFTHQVGDRVLKTLAAILAAHVRENDLAARLAGDEFVVMFAGADAQTATQVCDRIRVAVEGFEWSAIAAGLQVSVSIGVDQAREGDDVEALLHRSDVCMYTAKPAVRP